MVTGAGETGAALTAEPGVDKVTFTGSTATGIAVMKSAADHIAEVTLELGGKSPNIIFPDADIDAAVNGVMAGIFAATGQTCIAGSRFAGPTSRSMTRWSNGWPGARPQIKMGDPLDMETEMGPIAFAEQLDKVRYYVDLGVSEGATVVCGGRRPADPELADGYFFEPTILSGVDNAMRVAREEIFGPVLSVITFDLRGGGTCGSPTTPTYGLAAGVWTKDISARTPGRPPPQRRHHLDQLLPRAGQQRALRRLRPSGIGRENGVEGPAPTCKPNRSGSNSPATAATRSNSADQRRPS